MDKLKPCPFCGRTPIIHRWDSKLSAYDTSDIYKIMCDNLSCKMVVSTQPCWSESEAISQWNTRIGGDSCG